MPSLESELPSLAFIGGTGPEGRGLALRFAGLGHTVLIGSRSAERAEEAAHEIRVVLPTARAQGLPNAEAAASADIVFLTIPYSALAGTMPSIAKAVQSKVVISTIAPIEFKDGRPVVIPVAAGSAAEEVRDLLPQSRVVSAFQTVDAYRLQNLNVSPDTDVIVSSDDVEARRSIVQLANSLPGVRALSGGRLASSHFVEVTTALLITINRIYKAHSGLRLTGVER